MASLMPQGKQQYFDSNGNNLSGGKVFAYAAGTSTPLDTFSDQAGTIPNTNPVILNARGEATIFWGSSAYKVVLKDSSDVEIWTQDNLRVAVSFSDLASTASGNGASLVGIQDVGGYYSGTTTESALQSIGANLREKLTAARTYYVRTDGSDSNNGLADTSVGAFLTLQKAANVIRDAIDLNGYDVTVQVRNGTYTGGVGVSAPWVGKGDVYFIGDTTTPSNVVVSVTGGNCFSASTGGRLKVRGFKVSTTTSGDCIQAYLFSHIEYAQMDFGACAGNHVECGQGSTIISISPYTISGGAVGHWHCGSFGFISIADNNITLTGTPNFTSYFAGVAQGAVAYGAATFTGSATGKRFVAHHGGFIRSSQSETSLPGNVAGESSAGGAFLGGGGTAWNLAPDNNTVNSLAIRSLNFTAQTYNTHFQTVNDLSAGKGYFFTNGDDCFSSGRTHFASTAAVSVSSGTQDGWTFKSSAAVGDRFNASADGAAVGYFRRRTSNGDILGFYRDTTSVGSISVTTTATAYNTSSDYRLKDNVSDLDYSGSFIDGLRPRSWIWKADGSKGAGFIAHELQEVSPSSVTGEKDGPEMQSVHYSSAELIANLVAEVKSLRKRVESLEGSASK